MKGKHLEVDGSARLVVCCASPIAGGMALDRATHAFCSPKRRRVCVQEVKAFAEPMSGATQARIAALKPGHNTRLDAALRHARRAGPAVSGIAARRQTVVPAPVRPLRLRADPAPGN